MTQRRAPIDTENRNQNVIWNYNQCTFCYALSEKASEKTNVFIKID